MDIVSKPPKDLSASEIAGWRALLARAPDLANPHMTPDFALVAGAAFPQARVALAREGGEIVGVFPYRAGPMGFCRPIVGALSDFHGLIAAPETRLDIQRIARACGVRVFGYDLIPADQARHGFPGQADGDCAIVDLSEGYAAWRAGREAATSQFRRLDQKRRALERDCGIRVVLDDTSDETFDTLCGWKRAQLAASGYFDIFAARATLDLLQRIRARRDPAFRGVLSALYVDGRLAAAHFGMQAGAAFQGWFPGYDPEFGKHAIGKILWDEMARGGAAMGWTSIWLGRNDQAYKQEFANRLTPVMRGVLTTQSLAGAAYGAADRARRAAEAAPLGPLSALPGKAMRKIGRIADFGWAAA